MSGSSMGSGAKNAPRGFQFGKTYVIEPKGRHQATIVWLHGLGDEGSSWAELLETLPLPNIKWICPTAPSLPISKFGGFPSTAWCDVNDLSEDADEDLDGLEASATYVASLLSAEPSDIQTSELNNLKIIVHDFHPSTFGSSLSKSKVQVTQFEYVVKLGVGGFSMGAAAALYSATCFVHGKFENGTQYTSDLSAVVGLSGWLPSSKSLSNKVEGDEAAQRAASLPILLCHGRGDDVVRFKFGEKSSEKLISCGFQDCTFKAYTTLGHYTLPEELNEVGAWLSLKLSLEGSPQS